MKNRIIRPAAAALCALAGALLFAACKENTVIVGNQNVLPDALTPDLVLTDISTRTIHDDSIVTSGQTSPIYHTVGHMNADPYSGEVDASIYLQFLPPVTGWKVPTGFTISSAVAVLPYAGFTWGDTTAFTSPLYYNAHEIDPAAAFTMDNVYYAFNDLPVGAQVGRGSLQSYASLKDSVVVGTARVAPHLRIPVDPILPDLLAAINDDANYVNFLSHFKGLRISNGNVPGALSGVLPYFRLDGLVTTAYSGASLQLYASDGTRDTTFTFPFNPSYAGHFNRVRRDTTANGNNLYGTELAISRQSASRPTMFLHFEPGGAMDLTIRGIQSIPKGIINKAELVITVDETVPRSNLFPPPPRIYPWGIDLATGGQYTVLDRTPVSQAEPLLFIDGNLRTEANGTRAYHLNLPREVQRVQGTGGDVLRLKITGLQSFPGAYRLVAVGNDGSANRIRLNIVYTRQLQ